MTMSSHKFRLRLRRWEKHLANQVEQREDSAIVVHLAAVTASIGAPSSRRQGSVEPMPYRSRIIFAFALLAGALAGLSWWCP